MRCLSPKESALGEESAGVLAGLAGSGTLTESFQILALIYRMDFDVEL